MELKKFIEFKEKIKNNPIKYQQFIIACYGYKIEKGKY